MTATTVVNTTIKASSTETITACPARAIGTSSSHAILNKTASKTVDPVVTTVTSQSCKTTSGERTITQQVHLQQAQNIAAAPCPPNDSGTPPPPDTPGSSNYWWLLLVAAAAGGVSLAYYYDLFGGSKKEAAAIVASTSSRSNWLRQFP